MHGNELRAMRLWETGLSQVWINELVPIWAHRCSAKKPKASTRQAGIKLVDLTSAFLILGIGIGLGSLSFLLEIITARLLRIRKESPVMVL